MRTEIVETRRGESKNKGKDNSIKVVLLTFLILLTVLFVVMKLAQKPEERVVVVKEKAEPEIVYVTSTPEITPSLEKKDPVSITVSDEPVITAVQEQYWEEATTQNVVPKKMELTRNSSKISWDNAYFKESAKDARGNGVSGNILNLTYDCTRHGNKSDYEFFTNGDYTLLNAEVYCNLVKKDGNNPTLKIYADYGTNTYELIYESEPLSYNTKPFDINVDITNVDALKFQIDWVRWYTFGDSSEDSVYICNPVLTE